MVYFHLLPSYMQASFGFVIPLKMVFISNVQSSNYSNILTIVDKLNELFIIMHISQVCTPKSHQFFTQCFATSPSQQYFYLVQNMNYLFHYNQLSCYCSSVCCVFNELQVKLLHMKTTVFIIIAVITDLDYIALTCLEIIDSLIFPINHCFCLKCANFNF